METDPRQEWRTPQDFLKALTPEFTINFDVAASVGNSVVPDFYSQEDNGLRQPWFQPGVSCIWCNPGFKDMAAWVDKAINEVREAPTGSVALLLGLVAPSTVWWEKAEQAGAEIRLLAPRVQFLPAPGIKSSSNARENALFIFRNETSSSRIWTWLWKPRKNRKV